MKAPLLLLLSVAVGCGGGPASADIYPWEPHNDPSSCPLGDGQGFITVGDQTVCIGKPSKTRRTGPPLVRAPGH